MKKLLLSAILCLNVAAAALNAQIRWYDPEEAGFPVVQGQAYVGSEREAFYHRFPASARSEVRKAVWALSRQTAGESIRFRTDAEEITVRYAVGRRLAMNHMPATGVSGVDLYSSDRHGREIVIYGKYTFADTVSYKYSPLKFDSRDGSHEYTLFLPLYNEVKWMEIGVNDGASFSFIPVDRDKPIVAYGTSICQGACASRPGMAWTNILQRRMGRNVLNLGFSGNAYFEKGIVDLIAGIDAKVYILDGMPNSYSLDAESLRDTVSKAVRQLRAKRPETPILLVDHLGFPHGKANPNMAKAEKHAHSVLKETYGLLADEGIKGLHYLTYDELAIPQDGFVEGIHASDYGMQAYADAYEKKLREILDEPAGKLQSTMPVTQQRDRYDWKKRHASILAAGQGKHFTRVLIGDSITHFWGGEKDSIVQRGTDSWEMLEGTTFNMGCGYDRTENVLWRIQHDELDGLTADKIFVLIGTNNISSGDSDEDIVAGISAIVSSISQRRPEAEITVVGLLPRRDKEARVRILNKSIRKMSIKTGVRYIDPGKVLLEGKDRIDESMFADGLHPNEAGYMKIFTYFQ